MERRNLDTNNLDLLWLKNGIEGPMGYSRGKKKTR